MTDFNLIDVFLTILIVILTIVVIFLFVLSRVIKEIDETITEEEIIDKNE